MALELFLHREVGPLACNCYVVGDDATRRAIVIDPGGEADELAMEIVAQGLTITAIVATHAHFDHILAAERLREVTGAPFHLHREDRPLLEWVGPSMETLLGIPGREPPEVDSDAPEGEKFAAGEIEFEILHTPGHSPGSISLVTAGALFSGDTLFAGSVGRTDLPGGDTQRLIEAVRAKLFPLGDDVPVYPGHGPPTTIEREKAYNPFVGEGARLRSPER
ncbi:MAG: MBL fold metallo-hydrolase [Actinobacteria bacterium]|nr:MBL fold metallo-hydrolase [Actinomycetota bacterium]